MAAVEVTPSPGSPLRERIFQLVLFEPVEEVLASLGQNLAVLILAEFDDPVSVVEEVCRTLTRAVADANARDAVPTWPN